MQLPSGLRRAARALEPRAVTSVRRASAYGAQHDLGGTPWERIRAFRRAGDVGLHLLPRDRSLAGLVVDVGANRGAFTDAVRRLEPRSRVLAVEPVAENAAHLRELFAGDAGVTVVERAISDADGSAVLHLTEGSEFASLHVPRRELEDSYGDASRVVGEAEITTTTLDAIVDGPVAVLKIDVQGHEIPLLRGASATLERTAVVLIEVLFVSHYEGDAVFAEVDQALRDADFALTGLAPWGQADGPLLWADACYVPQASLSATGT